MVLGSDVNVPWMCTHVGCYGMLWCSRDLIRWYSLHCTHACQETAWCSRDIQFPWAWTHVGCYGPACLAGSVVTFPELPQNFVELNCSSVDVFDYCYWTCQEVKNKPLRCTWRALSSEQVVCTAWATSCSRIFVSYFTHIVTSWLGHLAKHVEVNNHSQTMIQLQAFSLKEICAAFWNFSPFLCFYLHDWLSWYAFSSVPLRRQRMEVPA